MVEASGLSAHCDFTEQAQAEQGRPDLVVHLPGDRHIVIDAKVPDLSFLNELETIESAQRKAAIEQHAKKCVKPSRHWPIGIIRSTSRGRWIAW